MRGGGCEGGSGGAVGAADTGFADPAPEQVLHCRGVGGDGRVRVVQEVGQRGRLGPDGARPPGTGSGRAVLLARHGDRCAGAGGGELPGLAASRGGGGARRVLGLVLRGGAARVGRRTGSEARDRVCGGPVRSGGDGGLPAVGASRGGGGVAGMSSAGAGSAAAGPGTVAASGDAAGVGHCSRPSAGRADGLTARPGAAVSGDTSEAGNCGRSPIQRADGLSVGLGAAVSGDTTEAGGSGRSSVGRADGLTAGIGAVSGDTDGVGRRYRSSTGKAG